MIGARVRYLVRYPEHVLFIPNISSSIRWSQLLTWHYRTLGPVISSWIYPRFNSIGSQTGSLGRTSTSVLVADE